MGQVTCAVDGCAKTAARRGWCHAHYWRLRTHGETGSAAVAIHNDDEARFWSKVDKGGLVSDHRPDLGPCWLWTASTNASGYGTVGIASKSQLAHRWSYQALVGPIPDGLVIDHLCRTRRCVNPGHMEPVEHEENNRRSWPGRRGWVQRERTHCAQGHPYDDRNTYQRPDGGRNCRSCDREKQGARRAARMKESRDIER